MLPNDRKTCGIKLMRKCIEVNLFKKARPEDISNRQCTTNDTLRQLIQRGSIGVHLRSSAVRFSSPHFREGLRKN